MPGRIPVELKVMEEAFYQSDEPPAWVGRHHVALRGIFRTMDAWRDCGDGDEFTAQKNMTCGDITWSTGEKSAEVQLFISLFLSWIRS